MKMDTPMEAGMIVTNDFFQCPRNSWKFCPTEVMFWNSGCGRSLDPGIHELSEVTRDVGTYGDWSFQPTTTGCDKNLVKKMIG